ncbi:MAG: hypothetical protein COT92_03155 [Candidatus Doudnabacteria bacterium CG10_big_fil_rev_8_21_14_0_10_42_18]|uniref:SCP domain-containing protein n=1 Tax=Candidatus Doudnabacteria bacterium CG10_big_fil_rev_8_21_14_0_10_42_18 TaxID=1974552 RepID=A0A2H0VAD0_9BACT|nr:MAG: hypothetical protein COT92_03155 [Candidatus Doudnabacteria bacterium CG10_big_fil_rev_8_21_14_0_10_42_18]
MKKFIVAILILVAGVAVFDYWTNDNSKIKNLAQDYVGNKNLTEITREVFTSGPLRNLVKNPSAKLTSGGVVEWTNKQRELSGLKKLSFNSKLTAAAKAKVEDMFKNQYFEHISPDGKGPADLANASKYDYIRVGENLALGNYDNDQILVEAWMNSPGHRANILNEKFTEIGVYVFKGMFEGDETWLAVQEFGKPASSCPSINPFFKQQISSTETEVDVLSQQIQTLKTELANMDPRSKEEYDRYNQKVSEFNSFVKIYNNKVDTLKKLTEDYNTQVKAYNLCASL